MKKRVTRKQNNSRNCFVCGVMNDMGLKAAFYELEDGTLCATGKARYVKQPLNVIGDLESNGDFWRCFPSEDDPEEIDIP